MCRVRVSRECLSGLATVFFSFSFSFWASRFLDIALLGSFGTLASVPIGGNGIRIYAYYSFTENGMNGNGNGGMACRVQYTPLMILFGFREDCS